MVCTRVTTSSAAHTVQCAGLRDAGEVSEASPRHWEGRDLALARSARHSANTVLPATAPAVRCQSIEGEEGQRSPAAICPGRRHAAAMPPLMLVCMQIYWFACRSYARASFRARGRQRVHRYSECAPRRRRSSPRKHALSPPVLRGDASGGPEGGALRATPAGRAHPSVRSRSGG